MWLMADQRELEQFPDTEKDRFQKIYHDEKRRRYFAKLGQVSPSSYLGKYYLFLVVAVALKHYTEGKGNEKREEGNQEGKEG